MSDIQKNLENALQDTINEEKSLMDEEKKLQVKLQKVRDLKLHLENALANITGATPSHVVREISSPYGKSDKVDLNKRGLTWNERVIETIKILGEGTTSEITDYIIGNNTLKEKEEVKKIKHIVRATVCTLVSKGILDETPVNGRKNSYKMKS
jgi:hypothetical protein